MTSVLAEESIVGLRLFTADEVLSPYVYVFYAAYLVAFIFTPVMRMIAREYGIVDEPDGIRKMHTRPVAYLGGVAVFLGWLAGLALSQFLVLHRVEDGLSKYVTINFGVVLAGSGILLLGLWDDVLSLSPYRKIMGQVLAGACLVAFGVGKGSAWIFLYPILVRTNLFLGWPAGDFERMAPYLQQHWGVDILSGLFVIAIVVVCCNAANLMDGLDGLCGGVTAVVAAGFLFLAVSLAMQSGALNANQDALRVVLGLALLGGVLGFVPHNFNPASVFMGDAGSMFLGFACATMIAMFAEAGHFRWVLAALVMFSLPLLDTALAFMRRWVNRRPIFSADRYHFHHQLVARGFTVKQTVLISYALTIIFCILGAAVVFIRTRYALAVYLVVFGSILVAAYKMGMVHERVPVVPRKSLGTTGAGEVSHVEPGTVLEVRDRQRPAET